LSNYQEQSLQTSFDICENVILKNKLPSSENIMRVVRDRQMQSGEIGIAQIQFNLRSRDDIPKVLRGLQHLYINEALREQVFTLLENEMAPGVDKHNGRPGMDLWRILVCGVLRLDLNIDYDRL